MKSLRMISEVLIVLASLILGGPQGSCMAVEGVPDFQNDVLPLLKQRCVQCHGPAKKEGELSLALPVGIRRGGEHGAAVVPGDLDRSVLWQRVVRNEMPVDAPLPDDEREILKRWIAGGAPGLPVTVSPQAAGEEHYAFQTLTKTVPPTVDTKSRLRNEIDRFIAAKLQAVGLELNPEADRETLIRRVSFDLTGLPPTVAEIDEYLHDQRDDAYERMVERYLDSKSYGERWGKYWLDAAGYADSNGYFGADTDRPLAYRYRDYVIRSINADKPWDEFIREQLAGDELAGYTRGGDVTPDMIERLEAAHFIRNSPDGTDSSDGNPDEVRADKYAVLEGTLQIMGSSLLGVTVQCARCHDHKFEPFSQQDYYRLQAVIFPALNIDQWLKPKERDISTATAAEKAAWEISTKAIQDEIAAKRAEFAEWCRAHRQKGREVFSDDFAAPRLLAERWSNTIPGDSSPAGTPAVSLDQQNAPAAEVLQGTLHLIESGGAGDRAISTRESFDWTPAAAGDWIQATFDLVAGGDVAPYVGYFIALRDFNDARSLQGGNILFDGAATGQASVYVDYPGADSQGRGKIGTSGYTPGKNYGVRVTNLGNDKYELRQVVDGVPEDQAVTLIAAELPDGGFGFEYCCGRSFVVDNVLIEVSELSGDLTVEAKQLAEEYQKQRTALDAAVKDLEARKPKPIGQLAAVSNWQPDPPRVHLLERGVYKTPGVEVSPGAPGSLSEATNPADIGVPEAAAPATGRRKAIAEWLTRPNTRASALLARVTVNRWWQHHFGTGIVATADNLGYSGGLPSHPELLDHLAGEFTRQNWSQKFLHRYIVNSAAYRQSSRPTPDSIRLDPDARLLSRYPFRRLDAEAIRDAMLAVSGELNPVMFGPYIPTTRSAEGDVVVADATPGAHRRSVYLQQRRTQIVGMLEAFDSPSITFNCTSRPSTTVPLQSLKLLNSEFVRSRAAGLAKRVRPGEEVTHETALELVFRTAWGRAPSQEERESAQAFLAAQPQEYQGQPDAVERAWGDLCQMLLAANAFLYLE